MRYKGLLVVAEKRWSNEWQALASYTLSKNEGLEPTSGAPAGIGHFSSTFGGNPFGRDPNSLTNATGVLPNDRTHVLRVLGSGLDSRGRAPHRRQRSASHRFALGGVDAGNAAAGADSHPARKARNQAAFVADAGRSQGVANDCFSRQGPDRAAARPAERAQRDSGGTSCRRESFQPEFRAAQRFRGPAARYARCSTDIPMKGLRKELPCVGDSDGHTRSAA